MQRTFMISLLLVLLFGITVDGAEPILKLEYKPKKTETKNATKPGKPSASDEAGGNAMVCCGYLLRENESHIELFNFSNGRKQIFPKSAIERVPNIPEKDCIETVGAYAYLASRIQEVMGRARPGVIAEISASGDKTNVYTTVGRRDGVKPGQKLSVRRQVGVIVDPRTKVVIEPKMADIGTLTIEDLSDKSSNGSFTKAGTEELKVGDLVTRQSKDEPIALLLHLPNSAVSATKKYLLGDADPIGNQLIAKLVERHCPIVERSRIDQVTTEDRYPRNSPRTFGDKNSNDKSASESVGDAQRLGRRLQAGMVLVGTLTQGRSGKPDDLNMDVHLVDVESGLIMLAVYHQSEAPSEPENPRRTPNKRYPNRR